MSVLTLTTDFGITDPFVGIMKGVIATRAPGVTVIDLTHGIPPQDVLAGALVLEQSIPYFPPGSVHVAVVDPGVGTERRALCVETDHGIFLGPDNGVLSLAAPPAATRRIVHCTNEQLHLRPRSSTFHGRDVFAPIAAAVASGTPVSALGVDVDEMTRLELPQPRRTGATISGSVIYVDHFGNLTTNVPARMLAAFRRATLRVEIGGTSLIGLSPSYAAGTSGALIAVINSWGFLEIAVRDSSAHERIGARIGDPVVVQGT